METNDIATLTKRANETARAILSLTDPNVLGSWGISEARAKWLHNKPSLQIHVHGYNLTGWAKILYNRGNDLYEVETYNEMTHEVQKYDAIYFDSLPELLDRIIETGEMTKAEYESKVKETYNIITL